MPTHLDEKRRRIAQFAEYLRLMSLRRHKVVIYAQFRSCSMPLTRQDRQS